MAAQGISSGHLAVPKDLGDPPSYADVSSRSPADSCTSVSHALHPRVAVLLGVHARWYIPLLICRALSTAPAAWWGLRCAFTFLGELLRSDIAHGQNGTWTVEKRFRVTEVFLAILWVCMTANDQLPISSVVPNNLIDHLQIVFCRRVSFLFFLGLLDVKMVRKWHAPCSPRALILLSIIGFYTTPLPRLLSGSLPLTF